MPSGLWKAVVMVLESRTVISDKGVFRAVVATLLTVVMEMALIVVSVLTTP